MSANVAADELKASDEGSLEDQLEGLFSEDIASVIDREKTTFDNLAAPYGESLVLFGAGNLGKVTLAGLRRAGIEPLAFADNNPALWGTSVDGLNVISAQEAAQEFGHKAVFIVTVYTGAPVRKQLLDLDLKVVPVVSLFWKYPEAFLPYVCLDLPHKLYDYKDQITEGLSVWADEQSRREYVAQIRWRLWLDSDRLPAHLPPRETYFPGDIIPLSSEEVFVDCGGYDGDTIRSFLRHSGTSFKQIVALEPDPVSFKKLQEYVSSLPGEVKEKVTLMPFAVSERREKLRFDLTGTWGSSLSDEGTVEIECISLDEALTGYKPTYVKMDVEGAEPAALVGARRVIEQDSPVFAIVLYHRVTDLWQIPLFIRSVSGRYRFFLRRYSDDCWEPVCYAVSEERLANQ